MTDNACTGRCATVQRVGTVGYLGKGATATELLRAVRKVTAGRTDDPSSKIARLKG